MQSLLEKRKKQVKKLQLKTNNMLNSSLIIFKKINDVKGKSRTPLSA